ncbi:MAG: hypothetical protein BWZ04_01335 [Firmicutes bacterium ADurb.BinA205]|nr:MAG: hypothetical protein BWZ04_01335 [Firmicutes bacterium ADurb.BinA205]
MKKRLPYIIIFIAIFAVETCIALFVHDDFVRPYIGDVIVMWAVYCLAQIILGGRFGSYKVAVGSLIFAFFVELLQKFRIVDVLGIKSPVLRTIIGTSFAPADLVCYLAGTAVTMAGIWVYNKALK